MPRLRLLFLFAAGLSAAGCGTRAPKYAGGDGDNKEAADPWAKAVAALRKEADPAGCRRVLGQLNADLASHPDPAARPAGLEPAAEADLRTALGLSDAEAADLRPASYSPLDAQYLAESLYLRDAARALDVAADPPARQAAQAFDWVCRQVQLRPWVSPDAQGQPRFMPPVPVTYVLRRGAGSGLERALVFLAVAQQLGLDGCLVGPPEAAGRGWGYAAEGSQGPPKGPMWAAGVRVGADVHLFDPWRDDPASGSGVVTLAQARATPDVVKGWGVPADAAKGAVPFLAVPMSAAAPRLQRLDKELRADRPVRLAADLAAVRARFAAEAKFPDVKVWSPPNDPFAYPRLLAAFLPAEEGGASPAPELFARYQFDLLPRTLFAVPADLLPRPDDPADLGAPDAADRLRTGAYAAFKEAFLTPPVPVEQVHRGRFADVTPVLVERNRQFGNARDRVRTDRAREQAAREWVAKARGVYGRLSQARDRGRARPGAAAEAERDVEEFWRATAPTAAALIDQAVADAGAAEATYLLAVDLHEQAERAQARYARLAADPRRAGEADRARDKAAGAWAEARGWWAQYEPFAAAQDRSYPGRAAHARRLADRAARLAADPKAG